MIFFLLLSAVLAVCVALGMATVLAARLLLLALALTNVFIVLNYVVDCYRRGDDDWREILHDIGGCALCAAVFLALLILI